MLIGIGVKELIIAESTFGNGRITEQHFKETGYSGLPEKYNIKLLNLNYSRPKKIKVDNHKVLAEIDIAEEIGEKYKIINLPVMKVHYATGLTAGIKNGCSLEFRHYFVKQLFFSHDLKTLCFSSQTLVAI